MTCSIVRSRAAVVAAAALTAIVAATPVASLGATVDGLWRLVEQSPGAGRTRSAAGTPDLRLALSRAGSQVHGEVWIAGREESRVAWPTLFHADEPTPVRVTARSVSGEGDHVVTRYEVADPEDPARLLEITEDYRVTEDGSTLVGQVTVRLRQDGRSAGQYVLHRRFERER